MVVNFLYTVVTSPVFWILLVMAIFGVFYITLKFEELRANKNLSKGKIKLLAATWLTSIIFIIMSGLLIEWWVKTDYVVGVGEKIIEESKEKQSK